MRKYGSSMIAPRRRLACAPRDFNGGGVGVIPFPRTRLSANEAQRADGSTMSQRETAATEHVGQLSPARQPRTLSPLRLGLAGLLLLVYAAPLFFPPAPAHPVAVADASFLERLFP